MVEKVLRKVKNAFYGVSISVDPNSWRDDTKIIKLRIEHLPSYLIYIALSFGLDIEIPRYPDKTTWEVELNYEGVKWLIKDHKTAFCEIYGPKDKTEVGQRLANKVTAAATIVNGYLKQITKQSFEKEQYVLHNQFYRSWSIYGVFRMRCEEILQQMSQPLGKSSNNNTQNQEQSKDNSLPDTIRQLEAYLNDLFRLRSDLEANVTAAAQFLFPITEIIFDACFALGDRKGYSFQKFRSLDWSERVKFFFTVMSSEVQPLYEKMIPVRSQHRNIAAHASPTYLFYIDKFGLIPSTYQDWDLPHMGFISSIDESEARNILKLFDDFMSLLKGHEVTKLGYMYAKSCLPIPIDLSRVSELRSHMSSSEEFQKEIEHRLAMQDARDNFLII